METTNQNSNPNALSDKDNVMHWVAVSEQLPETKQHVLLLIILFWIALLTTIHFIRL